VAGCVGVATCSLALPAAPGYDAWAWLIWGREVLALDLDTREGPAWKPLPVLITSALALGGPLAPSLWLVVARTAAVLALVEAYRLARRLAGGSALAGPVAVLGVGLCGGFALGAAAGGSEPMLIWLALLAVRRGLDGRLRQALAPGFAAALLRPEMWPFLSVLGAVLARRRQLGVPALAALSLCLAALWLVPDLVGAGELLRSYERARVPNPGAPALDPHPAGESLTRATSLPFVPLFAGVIVLAVLVGRGGRRGERARAGLLPGGFGLAWVGLVALMSEYGFSGEERYLMPGVAVASVSAAVGVAWGVQDVAARLGGARGAVICALATLAVVSPSVLARGRALVEESGQVAHAGALAADLPRAIRRAGGAARLMNCGPPHTGPYRGPLLAWHLGVHKAEVGFDPTPSAVIFRSRLTPSARPEPWIPASHPKLTTLARRGPWEVIGTCP
jgi:hypothetical protein